MRLVTFEVATPLGPRTRLGALRGEKAVVDLNAAYGALLMKGGDDAPARLADAVMPPCMMGFLQGGRRSMAAAKQALASASPGTQGPRGETVVYRLPAVRLRAPLPRPGSLRDFFSFEDHAKRGAARRGEPLTEYWYKTPAYYKGNVRTIYGPGDVVPWPDFTRRLDYELEIACVVGKAGRDLSPAEALKHVAGYTLMNDWSARDAQKGEMLIRMGPSKAKDFATSMGPYILTTDAMPDPRRLSLIVRVNGKVWSKGRFADIHWGFGEMLSYASRGETLHPGDVLGSGTFHKGCGLDLNRWIRPGDVVELEATGLGRLRSVVGRPKGFKPLGKPWR